MRKGIHIDQAARGHTLPDAKDMGIANPSGWVKPGSKKIDNRKIVSAEIGGRNHHDLGL
jgi:hypothetical protein